MNRRSIFFFGTWLGLLALTPQPSNSADKVYSLCVRNYSKIDLSSNEVDGILERATKILRKQNRKRCRTVTLRRNGEVTAYDTEYPASLSTSADFEKFTKDGCVKVVERITWCGGATLPRGGALGCAPVPGKGLVVVRTFSGYSAKWDKAVEPITWLHEHGHTLGIQHNLNDDLDVMAPGLDLDTDKVASSECGVYRHGTGVAPASPRRSQTAFTKFQPSHG